MTEPVSLDNCSWMYDIISQKLIYRNDPKHSTFTS